MRDARLALQQRLQHVFSNPDLLERALTHRSYSSDHYERLEFLGDSVLNLAVAHLLYVRLGVDSNPFIRVRERMVLTRPFRRVTWRVGNLLSETATAAPQFAKVVAMVSHGPLVQFPPKEYGLRRMPLMLYGLTATTANTAPRFT